MVEFPRAVDLIEFNCSWLFRMSDGLRDFVHLKKNTFVYLKSILGKDLLCDTGSSAQC